MRVKLLILAGPQSSGKTMIYELLHKKYPDLNFVPEINPYSVFGKKHPGGAFVDAEMQAIVEEETYKILKKLDHSASFHIMETGIFHLSHVEKRLGAKIAEDSFQTYLKYHKNLDPFVLFFDTKPHISFRRRKGNYLKRIKEMGITEVKTKKHMLKRYRNYIFEMYPFWIKWYYKIPFEKMMIKNSYKTKSRFLKEVEDKIINFL